MGINRNLFRPTSETNLKQFLKLNTRKILIVSEISYSFNDVTISLYYLNNIYDIDVGVQLY